MCALHMLVNFVIAGAFAGLAGALWGPFSRSVSPGLLGWQESGIAVFMTLIGGAGSFIGPMLGSVIYTFLQAVVTMLHGLLAADHRHHHSADRAVRAGRRARPGREGMARLGQEPDAVPANNRPPPWTGGASHGGDTSKSPGCTSISAAFT